MNKHFDFLLINLLHLMAAVSEVTVYFCRCFPACPAQRDYYGGWSVWDFETLFPKQLPPSEPLKNQTPILQIKGWSSSFSGISSGHVLEAECSAALSWSTECSRSKVSRNRACVLRESAFAAKNEKDIEKEIQTNYKTNQLNITLKESLLVFFQIKYLEKLFCCTSI